MSGPDADTVDAPEDASLDLHLKQVAAIPLLLLALIALTRIIRES